MRLLLNYRANANAPAEVFEGMDLVASSIVPGETDIEGPLLKSGANANAKMGMVGPHCTWHHFREWIYCASAVHAWVARMQMFRTRMERLRSRWNQRWEMTMSHEGVEETWYIEDYRVIKTLRVVSDVRHGIVGM